MVKLYLLADDWKSLQIFFYKILMFPNKSISHLQLKLFSCYTVKTFLERS